MAEPPCFFSYRRILNQIKIHIYAKVEIGYFFGWSEEINKILTPLNKSLFIESNPSPVKYAASLLGMCNSDVRLPLVQVTDDAKKKISEALKVAKIL